MVLYNKNLDLRVGFVLFFTKENPTLLNCFQFYLWWKKLGARVGFIPFQELSSQESQKELDRWFEILQCCSNTTGFSSREVMVKP